GEGIEHLDLPASAAGTARAIEEWRGGGRDAEPGWVDAGVLLKESKAGGGDTGRFTEGMLVRHDTYGQGRVTEVSGYGALRKVKVRFASAGERTFLAEKAKLTIVTKS